MDNKVANIAPVSADPALSGAAFRPAVVETPPSQPPAKGSDQADLRLVIEEDASTGAYVYKTVDRRTGEVVQQIPREEVLKKHGPEGPAGYVVNTRA